MPACRDERQKWQLHAACLEHVRLVMEAQPLDQLAQHRDACPPGLLPIIDLLTGGQDLVSSLPCFNRCGSGRSSHETGADEECCVCHHKAVSVVLPLK